MKIFYKKYKITIFILIYLTSIGFFGYRYTWPLAQKIQDQADQIQKKMVDNQKSRERISQIPRMSNAYDEYLAKKETLSVVLGNEQTIDFIKKIESIAESTGNEIEVKINDIYDKSNEKKEQAIQVEKKDEEKNITDKLAYTRYLPIQMTLRGSYQGLVNFMNKIENDQFFVNVISLQIKEVTDLSSNINPNADIFQAQNQLSEEEKNIPAPVVVPRQSISSNLSLLVYLKK